jgi:tetratricopeptide (TPR) repeat protein
VFEQLAQHRTIRQAYKQAATGRLEDALGLLRQAAETSDPTGDYAEATGYLLFQHGAWEEARAGFARALQACPDSMSRTYYLALSLARMDHWDEAFAVLNRAAQRRPQDLAPHAAMCLLLLEKQEVAAAQGAYDAARTLLRDHPCEQNAYGMGLLEDCTEALAKLPKPPPQA